MLMRVERLGGGRRGPLSIWYGGLLREGQGRAAELATLRSLITAGLVESLTLWVKLSDRGELACAVIRGVIAWQEYHA
jgi:hypothetical protein